MFAVELAGFAVMDNHLHLLVRLDSKKAREWSVDEVVRRWLSVFPLRDTAGKALPVSQARVELLAQDAGWVAKVRKRLGDLSWFMKCLKEPLARLANREEGCSGAFWEGRFKSIAVLDEESLLATAAYIDLNPVAAGLVATRRSPSTPRCMSGWTTAGPMARSGRYVTSSRLRLAIRCRKPACG